VYFRLFFTYHILIDSILMIIHWFVAGYNRVAVVEYLLQHGADVHAKDKGYLVPLHNAASYGHFEVTELLVSHGANVNAVDLWKFSPVCSVNNEVYNHNIAIALLRGVKKNI